MIKGFSYHCHRQNGIYQIDYTVCYLPISDGGLMGDSHDMTLVGRRLFVVEKKLQSRRIVGVNSSGLELSYFLIMCIYFLLANKG